MFREVNREYLKRTEEDRNLDKRWFRDADRECDIFVWQNGEEKIVRFQLWYHESLMEWDINKGLKTGKIDAATGAFKSLQTPIFRYHRNFDQEVLENINQMLRSQLKDDIPHDIFDTILIGLEKLV